MALSITFSSPSASPLPLVLVGSWSCSFSCSNSRRYRYFNVWRARARWLEKHLFVPMLKDGDLHMERGWQDVLAEDYWRPHYHIGFMTAVGRRIRRNYLWILLIQTVSYIGKLIVHPPLVHGGTILAAGRCGADPRGTGGGSRSDLCRYLVRYCAVERVE